MAKMKDEDYKLSMTISPRGKINSAELRQLLINRLSDTYKAILRRSLRFQDNVSIYCEDCGKWTRVRDYPPLWTCPECNTTYRMEFAVYEEMEKAPPVAEQ